MRYDTSLLRHGHGLGAIDFGDIGGIGAAGEDAATGGSTDSGTVSGPVGGGVHSDPSAYHAGYDPTPAFSASVDPIDPPPAGSSGVDQNSGTDVGKVAGSTIGDSGNGSGGGGATPTISTTTGKKPVDSADDGGGTDFLPWIIGGGAVAAAAGVYFLSRKKH